MTTKVTVHNTGPNDVVAVLSGKDTKGQEIGVDVLIVAIGVGVEKEFNLHAFNFLRVDEDPSEIVP